jgi:hypothetical protein
MKRGAFLTATMLTGLAACSQGGSSNAPASSAQPAAAASSAQPAAAAPPQTVQVAFDSLRSNGYMITSVMDILSQEQTAMWPNDPATPYVMITLQKGTSTAVCSMDTYHFLSLDDATMKNVAICYKR